MNVFWVSILLIFSLSANACVIKRDKYGRIARDKRVVKEFMVKTGYPSGRKGYVVDHVVPLCACGSDALNNLQWQSIEEAKKKDKLERKQCKKH
jgi:hypothetical protein